MSALNIINGILDNPNLSSANLKYCFVNENKVPYQGPCLAHPNNINDFLSIENLDLNYAQKYDIVRYHRHERNIGSDDNFEFVLKMADTKYRWLMSDTCYIDEVETVLNDLSHSDFDAYILPFF